MENLQVIQNMYRHFDEKNMAEVMKCFDSEVVWIRPGEPEIPYSGIFKGFEGLSDMFTKVAKTIVIKTFTPRKFLAQDDVVVVIGNDEADVISTGKSYSSDWVYIFTLKEQKITHVQAYIDTLEIAKAFRL